MTDNPRIAALKQLLERQPNDARVLFGLANEYEKDARWQDVVEQLSRYLQVADDEGNAWGRLARALRETGRDGEAREAYRKGVQVAQAHGHPSMAAEFEEILEAWE